MCLGEIARVGRLVRAVAVGFGLQVLQENGREAIGSFGQTGEELGWSGRAFGRPRAHASQPVVEPDREVAEDSGDADDRQVGEPKRLGAEQVAEG